MAKVVAKMKKNLFDVYLYLEYLFRWLIENSRITSIYRNNVMPV